MSGDAKGANKERARRSGRVSTQSGFTLVELVVVIMVMGIILTIASLSYASGRRVFSLKCGAEEVESAVNRAYNIALQEGVDVFLVFSGGAGISPSTYAIYRGWKEERLPNTPTEVPTAGSSYITDGQGRYYWFTIVDGAVSVQETVEMLFHRDGTVVTVSCGVLTIVDGEEVWLPVEGMEEIVISYGNETRTIVVSDMGEVEIR